MTAPNPVGAAVPFGSSRPEDIPPFWPLKLARIGTTLSFSRGSVRLSEATGTPHGPALPVFLSPAVSMVHGCGRFRPERVLCPGRGPHSETATLLCDHRGQVFSIILTSSNPASNRLTKIFPRHSQESPIGAGTPGLAHVPLRYSARRRRWLFRIEIFRVQERSPEVSLDQNVGKKKHVRDVLGGLQAPTTPHP